MNWLINGRDNQITARLRTVALVAGLGLAGLGLSACSDANGSNSEPADGAAAEPAAELAAEPTTDGLMARSAERWGLICNGDWIQVYDYYSPDFKVTVGLYQFLDGKSHHHYRDATEPKLVAVDGESAYVELSVKWKPTHPLIKTAEGGEDLEDLIEMVEIWEWKSGQWYFLKNERRSDFFKLHPEYLKK